MYFLLVFISSYEILLTWVTLLFKKFPVIEYLEKENVIWIRKGLTYINNINLMNFECLG